MRLPPRRRQPAVLFLIAAAAAGRRDLELAAFSESEVDWVIENGLGPLLHRATADDPERPACVTWNRVLSAELTARVITDEQLGAMAEILDACLDVAPVTLLKGISLGSQIYFEPHLRPMGDIDFLVPLEHVPAVEQILVRLGYERRLPSGQSIPEDHHHGTPFWHPGHGNWIEVHWGLVPPGSPLADEPAFTIANVGREQLPAPILGRRSRRLTNELQVIHVACHWALGIPFPGGLVALADLAMLLGTTPPLDWDKINRWLTGRQTAASVFVALTYLKRTGVADLNDGQLRRLSRQQHLRWPSLSILHWLIDRHVVRGLRLRRPVSARVFLTLWEELLRPQSQWINLASLIRYGLPRRLRRAVARH